MAAADHEGPHVDLAVLRKAIGEQVSAGSLRGVAREVGMSAPGLRSFLDGGAPYEATRRKLVVWYLGQGSRHGPGTTQGAAENAVSLLLQHLPPSRRASARTAVLRAIVAATKREGGKIPAWLDSLR